MLDQKGQDTSQERNSIRQMSSRGYRKQQSIELSARQDIAFAIIYK